MSKHRSGQSLENEDARRERKGGKEEGEGAVAWKAERTRHPKAESGRDDQDESMQTVGERNVGDLGGEERMG